MKRVSTRVLPLVLVVVALAGAWLAYDRWGRHAPLPEGLIQANGRIEGDRITVASKFAGRVAGLLVREGDPVIAGQVMIRLDDKQVRAQVAQARQAYEAIEAQVQAAHTDLAILNLDVPLTIERADQQVKQARAKLDKAVAVEKEARNDAERYRRLAANDNASRQQVEQAELKWEVARNDIAAAGSELASARKELAQAELGWKRIRVKEQEVVMLERQRDRTEAAWEEVQSVLADFEILAPTDGTVVTRMADIGEVVSPGTPLYEVVDLDRLYLKVYVPEVQIGKVQLGLPSRIFIDAFPDEPFPATVKYIASRAEFTPKEVQTPDERVKLVFAVRLYLDANPSHRLTPGLPADAVIRWKEEAPWVKPRW